MKIAAVIICTQNWSGRNSAWAPFTLIAFHKFTRLSDIKGREVINSQKQLFLAHPV